MYGYFNFGKKARNGRRTQRNNEIISAAKKNPSGIMKILARLAMGRKAASRRSATRRSRRSRRPPPPFPGMLTPVEFAAETRRRIKEIKAEIKEAEMKRIKALAAQQRATEMENGNAKEDAKKAANEAVDNAQAEIDDLTMLMSNLMHPQRGSFEAVQPT